MAPTAAPQRPLTQHPYDLIAQRYDDFFATAEAREEDHRVISALDYRGGSVLDIGCGTGWFLDQIQPTLYVGFDPSLGMLEKLLDKHFTSLPQGSAVLNVGLEDFLATRTDPELAQQIPATFDHVVAIYGSANYCTAEALAKIPSLLAPGGRYFVMLFAPDYTPRTYAMSGVVVPHHRHPADILPGVTRLLGNYIAIEGRREDLPQAERL